MDSISRVAVKYPKVLILGATGMLGSTMLRFFKYSGFDVVASARSKEMLTYLPENVRSHVISGVDVENIDSLTTLFSTVRPDVVINCIGLVKQLARSEDPLVAIPINALLPHRLSRLCALGSSRLIHMSTDCVFSGKKGMYVESDMPDASDIYGRSKLLGEIDYLNTVTLRTSIIGHELASARSLVCWFLAQQGVVRGFKKAIFSGLPTIEIARLIRDFVLPNEDMRGVYHVSSSPINKYELLRLVAEEYRKDINIVCDDSFVIDRSLDSTRFRELTGFQPKPWLELVKLMRDFG